MEVEDHPVIRTVLAGKQELIEFDTRITKGFELELRRRKGVVVLRLED